jgi:hypothetical protein
VVLVEIWSDKALVLNPNELIIEKPKLVDYNPGSDP